MVAHFGKIIINEHDNSINRQELGKIVFSDKNELSKLESIVWPEIGKMVMAKVEECGSDDIVILDAALLIEAGWYGLSPETLPQKLELYSFFGTPATDTTSHIDGNILQKVD